jgi:hypothetical protein
MFTAFAEITGYSFLIEIQNTSGDTSLNFIFKVRSHCSSVSCSSSCRLNKFCEFGENSTKGFLTQSYIYDDKEGKYWSGFSVSDSKRLIMNGMTAI